MSIAMITTNVDGKRTASRLARKAVVYLRQSSERQVQNNRESRELQYALVDRARALGWNDVEVIDDDLGASAGFTTAARKGFERLLACIALGVFLVFVLGPAFVFFGLVGAALATQSVHVARALDACEVVARSLASRGRDTRAARRGRGTTRQAPHERPGEDPRETASREAPSTPTRRRGEPSVPKP